MECRRPRNGQGWLPSTLVQTLWKRTASLIRSGAIYFWQKTGIPYIDRNGLSYFFLTAIFTICLAFPFAQREKRGPLYLGALATLCGCWVFLTTSRGGTLIGLFAALCLLAEIKGLKQRLMIMACGAVVAIGVLGQFTEIQDKSVGRITKLMDGDRTWSSRTSGRSELMRGAFDIFWNHPFGVGTGGYSVTWSDMSRDKGRYAFGAGKESSAHSAWTKTLAENGVPGCLLLFCFVFSFAYEGWRLRRHGLAMIGLLPTVAFSFAFLTSEFQGKGLWFVAAGVAVLLSRASAIHLPSRRSMRPVGKYR